ncbi:acetyl-CoA acetyltransferase [Brevundimonas sp. GN22]
MTSLADIEIPYGRYWSTPFVKWQGSLQHLHAMKLAAHVAKERFGAWSVDPKSLDSAVLGMTNAQYQSFYGAPWPLHEMGATHTPGHMLTQVCASGVRTVFAAVSDILLGQGQTVLALTADRCSNGAHIYYPAPRGGGGYGQSEDQVLYNMLHDAIGGHSMLTTAENAARKYEISTQEQHEIALLRLEQYQAALADDQAFQKRFMTLPFEVPKPNFKAIDTVITGDEGVFPSTVEGLSKLRPTLPDGTVTVGGQTHPADGNAGMIVASSEVAKTLSARPEIRIRIRGFGQYRTDLAMMPEAPVGATRVALNNAGISIGDLTAIKSHNPFVVNDIVFAKATGANLETMNNYGSSLIWGHPQGPTGMRAMIELIEELVITGGGLGLFQGCAAGDSAMAAVIQVDERPA